ncbi:MAG: DarT ssDNA thymidine ADP-ribosyltransferase family protein [Flavobacteriales bacterium]|nr:DarT ssDNA thymidine ADP-ribosyltransferase family protein [Flavobacteriales bacterium]
MNIFKYIVGYFKKIRSRFRKSSRNKGVIQRIEENKNKKLNEVDEKLQTLSTQEDNKEQVEQAINEKTSIEIDKELPQAIKEPIFDLVEIENEVKLLNQKLFEINAQKQKTGSIQVPSKSKSDEGIVRLEKFFEELSNETNIQVNTNIFNDLNDKKIDVESFFEEFRLIKIYRKREEKREREEQVKRQKVNAILSQIDQTLKLEKLDQTRQNVRIAERAILGLRGSKQKTKFQKRLSTLVEVFRKKEIEIEAERQRKKLERDKKEAERKRKEEEKRREEKQKRKKAEEEKRRKKEQELRNKESERKKQLQGLLTKKPNWEEFRNVLQENGITTFYHFTDRINIESIKNNGGLYSWYHCDRNNIYIIKSGGDSLSRDLDTRYRLQDYVRLSFCNDHPMQYRLSQSGYDLVLLRVAVDVAYFEYTAFSDINATDSNHSHGSTISDLKRINFSATKRSYVRREDSEFKQHQAEILVKTWIPLEYITNINQF